jgi:hypothetical protein
MRREATVSKTERYQEELRSAPDVRALLRTNSGLPGPRGNLELLHAFVEEGARPLILELASLAPESAPENTPVGFLACCGVAALGRLVVEGDLEALATLRLRASDPRWRVREAVAIALQRVGDADIGLLLGTADEWAAGSEFEQRAALAGICEPRLLKDPGLADRVLAILNRLTDAIERSGDRGAESFRVLRQALGYGWSVVVAAFPEPGKAAFAGWFGTEDRDVRWILRENLKKKRLTTLDPGWAADSLARVS